MKILFIQLPEQDPQGMAARGNVPLVAGSALAWIVHSGVVPRESCVLLDPDIEDNAGDAALIAYILGNVPDMLVFTLHDYNLARSLYLAKALRAKLPATCLAGVGPEVVPGMPLYKAHAFDALIDSVQGLPQGRGAYANGPAFVDLIHDFLQRSVKPRYKVPSAPDWYSPAACSVLDPYLSGMIPVSSEKPVFIGLPSYELLPPDAPLDYLVELAPRLLRFAADNGAREVALADPGLIDPVRASGYIKSLAAANHQGIPLLAHSNLQLLGEDHAQLWLDATLAIMRTPLLSTNPRTLEALGQAQDKLALERGAHLITSGGAMVKPSLYLGLPFDSYETTIETFDFLGMAGLGQDAELKPLMLRPGTLCRARATEFGITESLDVPPYWVVETETMQEEDMLDAVADFEESFDVALFPPISPLFKESRKGFISCVDTRKPGAIDSLLVNQGNLANSITLVVDADNPEQIHRLAAVSTSLGRENPFALWQIVLCSENSIPSAKTQKKLQDAFSVADHFLDLTRLYSLDPQTTYQTRLFFATSSESLALHAIHADRELETIFILGNTMPSPKLVETMPFLAFDREYAGFELLYDVMSAYRNFPDLLIEAPRSILG